jgi:hypothetical protein
MRRAKKNLKKLFIDRYEQTRFVDAESYTSKTRFVDAESYVFQNIQNAKITIVAM